MPLFTVSTGRFAFGMLYLTFRRRIQKEFWRCSGIILGYCALIVKLLSGPCNALMVVFRKTVTFNKLCLGNCQRIMRLGKHQTQGDTMHLLWINFSITYSFLSCYWTSDCHLLHIAIIHGTTMSKKKHKSLKKCEYAAEYDFILCCLCIDVLLNMLTALCFYLCLFGYILIVIFRIEQIFLINH